MNYRISISRSWFAIMFCLLLLTSLVIVGCGGSSSSRSESVLPVKQSLPNIAALEPGSMVSSIPYANTPSVLVPNMIGSDNRMAVVYECWYALRQSYLNTPNSSGPNSGRTYNGCIVSDWHYMTTDTNAVNYVLRTYGRSNVSVSSYFGTSDNYALQSGMGRDAQCVSFATMILYRARKGYSLVWNWGSISANYNSYPSARNASPGDLVFYQNNSGHHVAVCVRNLGGSGIDVVDSNWIGYGEKACSVGTYLGYCNSEMIGRHVITLSKIDGSGWKTYSGAGRWY